MQNKKYPYSLGLDIGIASVGWCSWRKSHHRLGGPRLRQGGNGQGRQVAQSGAANGAIDAPPATPPFLAADQTGAYLQRHGLIADANIFQPQHPFVQSLWQLRVDALGKRALLEEWARVIYRSTGYRSFHLVSRAEEKRRQGWRRRKRSKRYRWDTS